MLKLNRLIFEQHIGELEKFYNKHLSTFVRDAWYQRLSNLSDQEFVQSIALAMCKYQYMPVADQIATIITDDAKEANGYPEENWQAYQDGVAALPSEQMNMSDEQRLANIRRINAMLKPLKNKPFTMPKPNTEAIAKNVLQMWRNQGLID